MNYTLEKDIERLMKQCSETSIEIAKFKALVREMGKSLKRFTVYGDVIRHRDWGANPYKSAKELLSRPEVKAIMEEK